METNTELDDFIARKKANSPYITLADGETVTVKLRNIKMVTKAGFGGEEKETLRLECDVETVEGLKIKNFDNSTQRFGEELQEKRVKVGDTFSITRMGTQTKTRYTISNVQSATPKVHAAAVLGA